MGDSKNKGQSIKRDLEVFGQSLGNYGIIWSMYPTPSSASGISLGCYSCCHVEIVTLARMEAFVHEDSIINYIKL